MRILFLSSIFYFHLIFNFSELNLKCVPNQEESFITFLVLIQDFFVHI